MFLRDTLKGLIIIITSFQRQLWLGLGELFSEPLKLLKAKSVVAKKEKDVEGMIRKYEWREEPT